MPPWGFGLSKISFVSSFSWFTSLFSVSIIF
jgi:hypothetical protein